MKERLVPTRSTRWSALWTFLNSQFGLWMLSSVVLGLLSFWWTSHKEREAAAELQQAQGIADAREDSEFLGRLLPFFTSQDANVRLRAVDIVKTRYAADSLVPGQVQRLIASVLVQVSSDSTLLRNRANNNLVASAAEVLDRGARSDPRLTAALQSLPPRVYIHVPISGEPLAGEFLRIPLVKSGFLVPSIQRISAFPRQNEVRYYFEQDSAAAARVAEMTFEVAHRRAVVKKLPWAGVAPKPGTIELWLVSRRTPPGADF